MVAIGIVYSIRDEKGATSLMQVNAPSGTSLTDVAIFAQQMAPLIEALITGAITRIGLALTIGLPAGLRGSPLSGSDVEEGGRFQFRTSLGNYTSVRVPTFDESKIVAGSAEVDTTDADVLAFINSMLSGIDITGAGGSGIVEPSDTRDEDVAALEFAREQFQSSRR